ncbi:MAG: hypothetical protein OXF09_02585, partial [Hyphomicrobiales bacterium]|nr:hypothetical protein [Hyphomicrobiales bacterium]
DTETKEKLTEQQHQIEMLRTDVEGNMRIMKAENNEALAKNEAAIGGLLKDNEKLRTDMEKSINAHTTKMMIFLGVAVGIITLIVKFL